MIAQLIRFLIYKYYEWFPKYYFSWIPKRGAKTYWVNIVTEKWGEVQTKEVTKKKYKWFGKETTKTVSVYDVNSILFYAINDTRAEIKAKAKIEQFKNYTK